MSGKFHVFAVETNSLWASDATLEHLRAEFFRDDEIAAIERMEVGDSLTFGGDAGPLVEVFRNE